MATYLGGATNWLTTTGDNAITIPGSPQEGDLAVIITCHHPDYMPTMVSSGWSALSSGTVWNPAGYGGATAYAVWGKILGAGETTVTLNLAGDVYGGPCYSIVAYRPASGKVWKPGSLGAGMNSCLAPDHDGTTANSAIFFTGYMTMTTPGLTHSEAHVLELHAWATFRTTTGGSYDWYFTYGAGLTARTDVGTGVTPRGKSNATAIADSGETASSPTTGRTAYFNRQYDGSTYTYTQGPAIAIRATEMSPAAKPRMIVGG